MLIGWDIARPSVLNAYRGQVEVMLMSSALPRFHRAVLNFPLGRKVYLAQLMAGLLHQREALDEGYTDSVAAGARQVGAPVIHAALAGRLVTELPAPRLSFGLMALGQPRYWSLIRQAPRASLRASFSGTSAIVNARGETLARVEAEEGLALAEVEPGPISEESPRPEGSPPERSRRWPYRPLQWRLLERFLKRSL
jgi:predicted amidohydrolase